MRNGSAHSWSLFIWNPKAGFNSTAWEWQAEGSWGVVKLGVTLRLRAK